MLDSDCHPYRCRTCDHVGLCAPDCPIAPWNTDFDDCDYERPESMYDDDVGLF